MPHNTRTCWHDQAMAALTAQFRTDAQQGLTSQEAAQRLHQWGPNELRRAHTGSRWRGGEEPMSERRSLGERRGLDETLEGRNHVWTGRGVT
jgi:hypothetical protein